MKKIARKIKVALVHDDLIQWGGAENMLLGLSETFPDAPIYTSIIDYKNPEIINKLQGKKIISSFLQKIPMSDQIYKALLPLYPIAFEQFDFSRFDIVISQTTRFAKAIITKPETLHICYCHTPPRFLWSFSGVESNLPAWYLKRLKEQDLIFSKRVDLWVAGSENAKRRIKEVYNETSEVIYPFIELEKFNNLSSFNGDYLLVITRLNSYKRVDLVVTSAKKLKMRLKIVGIGPERGKLEMMGGDNIEFLGGITDELKAFLLSGCKALIVGGEEDFGLTSLEAQFFGKPVIAFGRGGALETIIEQKTGYFFKEQTPDSLIEALNQLNKFGYNNRACQDQAEKFSKQRFTRSFKDLLNNI